MFRFLLWALLAAILGLLAWRLSSTGRKTPRRRGVGWTLLLLVILVPALTQGHYMFLDEPLVDSARDGDQAAVSRLLDLGADVNDVADDAGGTALISAAAENHADVVRLLIRRGADVNKAEDYFFNHRGRQTPLQAAENHPTIIAMLRQAGRRVESLSFSHQRLMETHKCVRLIPRPRL